MGYQRRVHGECLELLPGISMFKTAGFLIFLAGFLSAAPAPQTQNEVDTRIVAVSEADEELLSTAVSSADPDLLRVALTFADPDLLRVALTRAIAPLLRVALTRGVDPDNLRIALTR